MSDLDVKYVGRWINLNCKDFNCTGKIESITDDNIILSNANLSNAKVSTRFVGIDINLILGMDFIQPPNQNKIKAEITSPTNRKLLNVYTSETQPPTIKRGGSSSAVNRNLTRQNMSQDKSSLIKNSSFNGFNSGFRKVSTESQINEPAWMNFSPDDIDGDFDFDKNLALFDKDCTSGQSKRCSNESSDSSDSVGIQMNFNKKPNNMNIQLRKHRSNTISFDPDDFSSYESKPRHVSEFKQNFFYNGFSETKRDILSEFKHIGIIPSSSLECMEKEKSFPEDSRRPFLYNLPTRLSQQPDLVREITQNQLINGVLRYPLQSAISINCNTEDFHTFQEFWNLDNDCVFPVFTVKQRNLLLETACQLGHDSKLIGETIGENISNFVLSQIRRNSRFNESNSNRVPKIVILLGKCNASVYAVSVSKYLLKKGCQILVFIDEKQVSDINYSIDYEIKVLNNMLSNHDKKHGFNFISYNNKDLHNKSVDFIISGLESDSSHNSPSDFLQYWCSNQKSHLLCINPPKISCFPWKSAIFVGVPTFSQTNLNIKMLYHNENGFNRNKDSDKNLKKSDGLILLCNLNLPEKVFTFLNLNYQSPFGMNNWIRLYRDNDLGSVE